MVLGEVMVMVVLQTRHNVHDRNSLLDENWLRYWHGNVSNFLDENRHRDFAFDSYLLNLVSVEIAALPLLALVHFRLLLVVVAHPLATVVACCDSVECNCQQEREL